MRTRHLRLFSLLAVVIAFAPVLFADDNTPTDEPDPKLGYDFLLHKPMSAVFLKSANLDRLWLVWEPEEKAKAEAATPEERRKMTFARYGFAERPNDTSGLPLDYTEDGKGNLVTNCFSCHGGTFMGKTIPGMGNTHVDLTTLAHDVQRLMALDAGRDISAMTEFRPPVPLPLNFSRGNTNAVTFAPFLGAMRDDDMNIVPIMRKIGPLTHHDMNAPPWWNVKYKKQLYADGFAPKSVRALMPFATAPNISGEEFRGFEPAFVNILAYIENLEPPKYPLAIDAKLAEKGREAFEQTCAKCHGHHDVGPKEYTWPAKAVPLAEIGTDPVRFGAITKEMRIQNNKTFLQYYGKDPMILESEGYMAPPLWGIWATAPYFHNGSVPTIAQVFTVASRPKVWKNVDEAAFDEKRIGLKVEELDAVPEGLNGRQKRYYYDTTGVSHSNQGHTYPDDELSADEKIAVMEYLKTL